MIVESLLAARDAVPDKVAVSDGIRTLTYKRLALLARVIRDIVRSRTEGDKVGIMLPASAAFPAALFGTLWSGKVAVPLNFLLNEKELAAVADDAGLDLILTVRHFEDSAARMPAAALFLEDLGLKRRLLTSMVRSLPPVPEVTGDELAILLYTSGTTGAPKGVQLSYNNLHSNCVDTIETLAINPDQVFLNVLPPFHVFGVTAMVILPVMLRATVVALPRFSPMGMIKAVENNTVTITVAIPSMYAAVLRTRSARANSFRSVYLAISGGEPLPAGVRDGFKRRFGVDLREGYGLTETSPVVATNTPENSRIGTVGKPIRNVEVQIVTEEGREAAIGQHGEIRVRSPGVMTGYYGKPKETREVLDGAGWFRTGDIGCLDDEGFLSITGRAKDMMIVGGENVFPREIESVLEEHPDVLQVAVIGMPDDLRGEVPVAFVIPQAGAEITEEELRNFAKRSVAGFKVPRRVIIRDDLPQGPTGKLLKRQLPGRL